GDDQAEGLGEVRPAEPALGLGRVHLVPTPAVSRVAAAEVLRLRVLARVGSLPVGEAVVSGDSSRVALVPAAEEGAVPGGVGEMPLALVGHLVPGLAKHRGEVAHAWREDRLISGVRTEA